ncbi:MAG: 50S ribosome-binding GTPase [Oscillospiraceae bacterium]|nr:50S ribosome-binding GTPase [Oscillospiraceae bacterium]
MAFSNGLGIKKTLELLIPKLRAEGMSDDQIKRLASELEREREKLELPKIALIGFAGVGKSSTINALFNAGQPISDVRACTKEEAAIHGDVSKYTGSKGSIIVYDMPGLGEDIDEDSKNLEVYKKVIPKVDVSVWTFTAGDRAMKSMQETLLLLEKEFGKSFTDHLVFAINKADITAPGEIAWNLDLNSPSPEQRRNIKEFEKYFKEKVLRVFPAWKGEIVSFSAKRRYQLDILMTAIVAAVPERKRFQFGEITDVADFRELINKKYLDYINKNIGDSYGK